MKSKDDKYKLQYIKDGAKTMQQRFNLSEQQIVYSVFTIYFLHNFFMNLRSYLIGMGFPRGNPGPYPAPIAYTFRAFFIYQLIPALLIFLLVWNHIKKGKPNDPNVKYSSIFLGVTLWVIVFSFALLILVAGLDSKIIFFDYQTRTLNLLVYSCIALYITYVMRKENALKLVLFVAWAILVVTEVWEIPFTCLHLSIMHPYVAVTGYVARYAPIFVWFYFFRQPYINLIQKKFSWVLPCLVAIVTVTVLSLFYRDFFINIFLSTSLRALYGMLLIFLPFHFQK